jgi:hypothetical protein
MILGLLIAVLVGVAAAFGLSLLGSKTPEAMAHDLHEMNAVLVPLVCLGTGYIVGMIANLRSAAKSGAARAAAACVLVVCVYSALYYFDNLNFRTSVLQQLSPETTAPDVALDQALVAKTGHSGMLGYVILSARSSVPLWVFTIPAGRFATAIHWSLRVISPLVAFLFVLNGITSALVERIRTGKLTGKELSKAIDTLAD